jgi:DNA-binding HxlR family transcriptional regulator
VAKRVAEPTGPRAGRPWTFLTNHGHVLVSLHRNPESRIRDLASEIGITERAVQTILAELEADGYVTKVKVGRRNEYRIHAEQTFRHPAEASRPVGELLRIFDDRRRR